MWLNWLLKFNWWRCLLFHSGEPYKLKNFWLTYEKVEALCPLWEIFKSCAHPWLQTITTCRYHTDCLHTIQSSSPPSYLAKWKAELETEQQKERVWRLTHSVSVQTKYRTLTLKWLIFGMWVPHTLHRLFSQSSLFSLRPLLHRADQ